MDDDGTTTITIGELARRTGLPVRTLRFYSDRGVVAPVERSEAGYRRYRPDAVTRVALVRTLRELGVDLPTIRRVLERELDLAGVAAAHASALDAQIRVLRLSRTIARLVARRASTPQEMTIMHQLARLSEAERRRIVDGFLDDVLGGLDVDPDLATRMRAARPDLPDDPSPEQVEAWIELAQLIADPDFRRRIRGMSERGAADRSGPQPAAARDRAAAGVVAQLVAERAGAALAAGVDPRSDAAAPIVDELVEAFAGVHGREDDAGYRVWLAELLETGTDARAERYWQLLAVINGWPAREPAVPAWEWFATALHERP
jgi:DNA-binding transcriptional MerR regulator